MKLLIALTALSFFCVLVIGGLQVWHILEHDTETPAVTAPRVPVVEVPIAPPVTVPSPSESETQHYATQADIERLERRIGGLERVVERVVNTVGGNTENITSASVRIDTHGILIQANSEEIEKVRERARKAGIIIPPSTPPSAPSFPSQ